MTNKKMVWKQVTDQHFRAGPYSVFYDDCGGRVGWYAEFDYDPIKKVATKEAAISMCDDHRINILEQLNKIELE